MFHAFPFHALYPENNYDNKDKKYTQSVRSFKQNLNIRDGLAPHFTRKWGASPSREG